jgi:hypothetical protein
MSYFRELPNLQYQSFLTDNKSSGDYITVKNLFRRVKLRDDLQNVFTVFNKYQIPDGSRPELVAEEIYGSSQYDWVVLISAGIKNVRNEWPLSDRDIYRYSEEKYGIQELNAIRFYETIQIKDPQGRLVLPKGQVVEKDFTFKYWYNEGEKYIEELNPVIGISNYEYEVRKNDEKRGIYILKPLYLQQFIKDMRRELIYDRSSQYVNNKLIRTENTKVTLP